MNKSAFPWATGYKEPQLRHQEPVYIDADGKAKHGDFPALSNWLRRCDSLADAKAAWEKDVSAEGFLRRPMLAEKSTPQRSVPGPGGVLGESKKMGEVRYLTHFVTQNLLVRYRTSQLFEHFLKRWQPT